MYVFLAYVQNIDIPMMNEALLYNSIVDCIKPIYTFF